MKFDGLDSGILFGILRIIRIDSICGILLQAEVDFLMLLFENVLKDELSSLAK